MNIYDVVYQLVLDNDCVIVPNFGGFVTNRFSADIDFAKQEFCPPSRKVAFNESLSLSDGLLLNHISQLEKISWQEADEAVNDFVSEIKNRLAENQTVTFVGLGEFSRKSGSLVFSPATSVFYDEAFGLPTFNFPMISSGTKPRVEVAVIKGEPDKNGNGKRTKVIAWTLSSVAAVAGIVCMSFAFGWFDNIGNGDGKTIFAGFGFGNKTENVEVVESQTTEVKEITPIVEEEIVVAEEVVAENVEPEVVEVVEEPEIIVEETPIAETVETFNTHVIAGCFSELKNAENLISDLQSKGLNPQMLPMNKGLYRVSAKGFANSKSAYAELNNLKSQTGIDALWVLNF